uniref:Nematode cuticle collagen N-terminal domain-containing protein n=1 Tax=Plectus sambesii TaxID=2011161 RepID=A0A914VC20_9BILA
MHTDGKPRLAVDVYDKQQLEVLYRRSAFIAVVVSTFAAVVCGMTLPLCYNHLQFVQSSLENEIEFCMMRSVDLHKEFSRIELMAKRGGERMAAPAKRAKKASEACPVRASIARRRVSAPATSASCMRDIFDTAPLALAIYVIRRSRIYRCHLLCFLNKSYGRDRSRRTHYVKDRNGQTEE